MIGIIIVSHGELSKALIQSVEMVYGNLEKVEAICIGQGQSVDTLKNEIDKTIEKLNVEKILILVDLLGGTPYNASSVYLENPNINIVTGVNMSMILEILPFRELELEEIAHIAMLSGKSGIINVNECFENISKSKNVKEKGADAKNS